MNKKVDISVLDGSIKLMQPEKGFRIAIDSVLLAASCPAIRESKLLDAGCGVGAVGLCVNDRVGGVELTGVDVQELSIDLAMKNSDLNNVDAKWIVSDIRNYEVENDDRFDHIVCNPPYMESGKHVISPIEHKALSNGHMVDDISLDSWIKASFRLLKSKGTLTMIHRADVANKIISLLDKSFGAIELIPLWPRSGVEAKRVIIRAIKDRKTPLRIHYGLVLHESDGTYTKQADEILREGRGLYV